MNPWSGTHLAPPPKRARAVCLLRRDIRRLARRFLPLHRPLPRCVRWQAAQTRLPLIRVRAAVMPSAPRALADRARMGRYVDCLPTNSRGD